MKKYDPIIEDPHYWKYQGLVESWVDFARDCFKIDVSRDDFISSISHLASKLYEKGTDDARKQYEPAAPVDKKRTCEKKSIWN